MAEPLNIQIGLYISESFGELILKFEKNEVIKRWFWPSTKPSLVLKEALKTLDVDLTNVKVDLNLGLRFFEKVFDRRLSGNVAQIVTSGFENWVYLRQPLEGPAFSPSSQRRAPLANPDLVFPLNERMNSEGQVIHPILESDLEAISAKLKLMKVEKIALNLMHGNRHPAHQNLAAEYFKAQGFSVFVANHRGGREDEVQRWRRNLMNAGMSGTIEDTINDIKSPFLEQNIPFTLKIATTSGLIESLEKDQYLDTLMGPWHQIISQKNKETAILYLGLEKFIWISNEKTTAWNSPWGPVNMQTPKVRYLRLQPTLRLDSGWLSEVEMSFHEEGFEPGPMCLGRSVKPTVFDVWAATAELKKTMGLETLISQTGQTRFLDIVKVWLRSAKKIGAKDELSQVKELRESIMDQLAVEIDLLPEPINLELVGPLAATLGPELKKRLNHKKIELNQKEKGFEITRSLVSTLNEEVSIEN